MLVFPKGIEVVLAGLPKVALAAQQRDGEIECLDGLIKVGPLWLVHHQGNMLEHYYGSGDDESVLHSDILQRAFTEISCFR